MAVEYTPKLGIPKIDPTVDPRIDIDVNTALDYIDANVASDMSGPMAARPQPGIPGRYYTVTDQSPISTYRDNGSVWVPVTNHAPGSVKGRYLQDGAITMDKVTPKTLSLTWITVPISNILHSSAINAIQYSKDPYGVVRFRPGPSSGRLIPFNTVLFHLEGIGTPQVVHNRTVDFEISYNNSTFRFEVKTISPPDNAPPYYNPNFHSLRFLSST